jgi:hypothetical protein
LYYSEDIIEEVRSRNDIVDVIGGYVTLKRRGNSYMACCPFHHEKTPSFHVNRDKQMYHCFGCGVGGNDLRPETKKPASYVSSDGMIWNAKSDPGLSEILYANRIFLPALLVLLSDPQSRHMYDRFDVLFFLILLELSIFFPFVHVKTHLYNIFHTFLIFPLFFYKKIRNSLSQTVPYLYL